MAPQLVNVNNDIVNGTTTNQFLFENTNPNIITTTTVYSPNSEYSYYGDYPNDKHNTSASFTVDSLIGSSSSNGTSPYYYSDDSNFNDVDNNSSFIITDMNTFATPTPFSPEVNGYDNSTASEEAVERQVTQFWIGVALSISSSLFIGLSFIIKKKALIKLSQGGKRANQGGYGYLKDLLWWSGLLSMAVGEAANFMAYTFAPASLVSTLGVLSVLVTAILSSKYLHERLNFLGKIGCFLCTIGSTVIVIHAPMEKDIESMEDLEIKLTNFIFLVYVLLCIVVSVILIYHYRPKLPETSTYTLLIWIGVCSMIGSLSVMSVKGLGLALMNTVTGIENELNNWLTWFCFVTLVICVSVQMNFLNKALDTFNTAVVTPIYYVFFTSCVILASAILFNEFDNLPIKDWLGLSCGFLTVLLAIALLHLCKNFEFTLATLAQQIDLVNSSSQIGGLNATLAASTHVPVKGDNFSIPRPSSSLSTACVIPQVSLKRGGGSRGSSSSGSELEEEIYKSVDSGNSGRCSNSSKKGPSQDSRLLSGSYSPKSLGLGSRTRDGYIPLSYGTTDNRE